MVVFILQSSLTISKNENAEETPIPQYHLHTEKDRLLNQVWAITTIPQKTDLAF